MLRRLTSDDYTNFFPLINEFRETSFTEDEFRTTLQHMEMNQSAQIWIIEENNECIAAGTIYFEKKFIFNLSTLAHIEDVIVKESYRRKGYGKCIVKHLLHVAKENPSCYKVTLDCNDLNVPFYESCGLERRGNQMCNLTINL